ncbi:MAG: hypothetical protein EON57_15625, partial [Alphaproteobacteria bacterium]
MNAIQRAVAMLFAASTFAFAGSAEAAVMFHAYNSNGGTCAERVSGGYALKPCDKNVAAQRFTFDVNGMGGPITQSTECLVVISGYTVGSAVAGRNCTDTKNFTSKKWRWTNGTQIIATESPSQGTCLSAAGPSIPPPRLVLQACNANALLTRWDVLQ